MPDDHMPARRPRDVMRVVDLPSCACVLALSLTALPLAGCGSSSKNTTSAQVKTRTCKQVEAVLSDGPEPEADPLGYAQAQILPLRQIHTSDEKLRQAIDGLASAYQAFSASNGAGATKSAVSAASKTIDAICPGATS
jgi:hypothetical protein